MCKESIIWESDSPCAMPSDGEGEQDHSKAEEGRGVLSLLDKAVVWWCSYLFLEVISDHNAMQDSLRSLYA